MGRAGSMLGLVAFAGLPLIADRPTASRTSAGARATTAAWSIHATDRDDSHRRIAGACLDLQYLGVVGDPPVVCTRRIDSGRPAHH